MSYSVGTAISSDGVEISYHKKGKGKPALVFVHGWTNNKSIWDAQVAHFSEKYKVVTIDLAGHGASGYNRNKWSMTAFGDDVVDVIHKLKLKQVVLVGFSLGGPVTIEVANKVPGLIDGVMLVDAINDIEMKYSVEMIDNINNYMMDIVTNPTKEKFEGVFCKRNLDESYNRFLSVLNSGSQVGWEDMLNELFRWLNEDCVALFKNINVPIMAINSDSEPTNIDGFRKYATSFNAKIIKDVGHCVFWDAPDEFNGFLEESI